MNIPLRVLIIEDSEDDALLVTRELKRVGYEPTCERVDSATDTVAALDRGPWDVVVSDYNMPNFSGTEALRLLRARDQDTPFIFVSGTIGEDVAVDALRAGAQDYVIKGNLRRLAPAIERELRDAALRRERRASEARFRRVVECRMIGMFFWDASGRITEVNDEFLRIVGYAREEFPVGGINWRTFTPAEYEAADAHALDELLSMGVCTPYEKEHIRKDGTRVPVLVGGALLDSPDSGVAFVLDITERRRAAEAVQVRARQQTAVAELGRRAVEAPEPAALFDVATKLVVETLDVAYAELLELGPAGSELVLRSSSGGSAARAGHVRVTAGPQSHAGYALQHHEPVVTDNLRSETRFHGAGYLLEYGVVSGVTVVIPSQKRPFGVLGAYSARPRQFTQDDIHFLQAVAHILSTVIERERADTVLRLSQRLESVGRLAGGIAHDFNNLLTGITGYAEFLLIELQADARAREDIEEILKAAHRAASLTRQLLAFSRRQVLEPTLLDLNSVVEDMEKMLRRLIGEDIALHSVLEPDLGVVRADRGQVEQVILNLVVNARDAMPRGGELTIVTANTELDEQYADQHTAVQPGRYVMVAVSDTGSGMDKETQSRIFEPFFTTKAPEQGSGLGLSTVYGIVKQSGGNIWVYSELGRGTTFRVYLPVVADGAPVVKAEAKPTLSLRGSETVLVAEDEDTVRRLTERTLQQTGYTVLGARNGTEALRIAERHPGPIHLLVSDVVMPQLGGGELAARLTAVRPGVRVLYLSGYTDPNIAQQGLLQGGAGFLQKPFTMEALTRKVREVLDARPQGANGEASLNADSRRHN